MADLAQLTHTVECSDNGIRWEVIAAFNVERAATYYATDCYLTNCRAGYRYRVRDIAADTLIGKWGF